MGAIMSALAVIIANSGFRIEWRVGKVWEEKERTTGCCGCPKMTTSPSTEDRMVRHYQQEPMEGAMVGMIDRQRFDRFQQCPRAGSR
jgi:hypothetical protein